MDLSTNYDATRQTIRHGEVYFIPVKTIPEGKPAQTDNGRYVVGHSETGHHHTIAATDDVMVMEPINEKAPEGMTLLYALVKNPGVIVEHDRTTHRHADTLLSQGAYQIRTQRGMTPQGWARAID
jgi:hypothetical protein